MASHARSTCSCAWPSPRTIDVVRRQLPVDGPAELVHELRPCPPVRPSPVLLAQARVWPGRVKVQTQLSVEFALRNAAVQQNWRCSSARPSARTRARRASPRVTAWWPSSAGIGLREVRRGARRGSPRAAARGGDQARERMRVVAQRVAGPAASRIEAGVAPQRLAGLARWAARAPAPAGGSPARSPRGSASAASAARAPEHEALAQRVGGEAVGAVQAGAGALADRVEAGDASARRRGRRRRRPSCSARPGATGTSSVAGSRPASRSAPTTLGKSAGSTARMSRSTLGRPLSAIFARSRARPRRAARARRRSARRRRRAAWRPRRGSPR